jgi:hypothetical protein
MNLALDNLLSDTERRELDQHLIESPSDRLLWEGMQTLDLMLSNERVMPAPPDFASKVMASIAAGKAPQPEPQRTDLRAVIALLLTIAIILPLVVTTMLFIRHLLTDATAQQVLIQQIMFLLSTAARAISSVFEVVANYVASNVLIMVLLIMSAGLTTLTWGWMIRYFATRRQQVVYRIPVQAA